MILRDVEVRGRAVDVRFTDGIVTEVGHGLRPRQDDEVVEGRGGSLLPGLHDHHLHLRALAAARASVSCRRGLDDLRLAPGDRVRGVLFPGSVDRHELDLVEPHRPVRVQHRSGALWMLNSAALEELAPLPDLPGVERDADGRPTGRLWRLDHLLRGTWPMTGDLAAVGRELASYGITGVTDATPDLSEIPPVPQRVTLLGRRKLLLHDHDLPDVDTLAAAVRERHDEGLPVAVHCVTRDSLLLTLAVLDEVGRMPGDRIEHGAVVPDPSALRGLHVVTQPGFLADRGHDYVRDVDAEDLPHLYPYAGLLAAGVDVLPSSDAPYGPLDPWAVVRAAVGRTIVPQERVPAATVLEGYLRDGDLRPRSIAVGSAADLVLLHLPLAQALRAPDRSLVRATWIAGRRAW